MEGFKIITFGSLQNRDKLRHPIIRQSINNKNIYLEIYNLQRLIYRNSKDRNPVSFDEYQNIKYISLNTYSQLFKILKKYKSFCIYRLPKVYTSVNHLIIVLLIAFLSRDCILYDLNPPPEYLLKFKNFAKYVKEKFKYLKRKNLINYYRILIQFSIATLVTNLTIRLISFSEIFTSGSLLEQKYRRLYKNVKISRIPSFDYYKLINKNTIKDLGIAEKTLFYIDGGHLYHSDQADTNRLQDCDQEKWEILLNSLFQTYRKAGYQICVVQHPNLLSDFYINSNVIIVDNIFKIKDIHYKENLIVCSSSTLSLLVPFLNNNFIILYDKSILYSKLYADILALSEIMPKHVFIKEKIDKEFDIYDFDLQRKNEIKNLFLL